MKSAVQYTLPLWTSDVHSGSVYWTADFNQIEQNIELKLINTVKINKKDFKHLSYHTYIPRKQLRNRILYLEILT